MKRGIIFVIIILLAFSVYAQAPLNDYNDYSYLDMKFVLNGGFDIVEKTRDSRVAEILANLTFFPRSESNQEVSDYYESSNPNSKITRNSGSITYFWKNPEEKSFEFNLGSDVKIRNALVTVDQKIDFPLSGISEDYTKPTEFIDINDDIEKKAQELAEGEDDLYFVSIKVADWVQKNIKYDLSTLTADAVQKSSWVMKNKEGVCDELTNLFISMMRSLGVPARYVSGMAYTNTINQWGPHAWAEVYFPDKGWVPFDVTYVQYGWIDPSHIKVKTSEDSGDPAIKYSWKSVDTDFIPSKLNATTVLVNKGSKIGEPLKIKIKPLEDNVGPGSYIPIEVEVSNNNNFYFPATITISKAPEILDRNYKAIVLMPGETKKVAWIAKIPSDVEENYLYRSRLEAEDNFHNIASSEVTYSKNFKTFSLEEAEKSAENSKANEYIKKVSQKISIDCSAPEFVYINEVTSIKCRVNNLGNVQLHNVNVCLNNMCNKIETIGISGNANLDFSVNKPNIGVNNFEVIAKVDNIESSDIIKIEAVESAVDVSNFIYEKEVEYKAKTRMEVDLAVKMPVNDVKVYLNNIKVASIDELNKSNKIVVVSKASEFSGSDKLILDVKFKDKNKENSIKKEYPIKVLNTPWYAKFLRFFNFF